MQLILARHGNTFGPGDRVVWLGARTDLDLVEKGLAQARSVAAGLKAASLIPARIYCGPLKRTKHTALIIASACGLPAGAVVEAQELREIDYGTWEARTNDEIRIDAGDWPIDRWQKDSIWPDGFGWGPGEAEVVSAWNGLLATIRRSESEDAVVLFVSSNGIFRLVAKSLGLPSAHAKMNTGAVSRLILTPNGIEVSAWNLDPELLAAPVVGP